MIREEMWTKTVDKLTAICYYLPESHEFEVEVKNGDAAKSRLFLSTFEPIWGMDVDDIAQSHKIAEELALEIENEKRVL
jgi:hypothetical protein